MCLYTYTAIWLLACTAGLRKAELDTETKKMEQVLLDRQKGEMIRQAQSHMLERMRVDLED